jgi:transposase
MTNISQLENDSVIIGVDTHLDVHVAASINPVGCDLDAKSISTTPFGYRTLLSWARDQGQVVAFGIEGTGSYGAGLARFLRGEGETVIEVNRPDRMARRLQGKSDPVDARAAARAVLANTAVVVPKTGESSSEMIRALRVARTTAIKARTQAMNAMKALLVTAPAELRETLAGTRWLNRPESETRWVDVRCSECCGGCSTE